MYSLAKKWMVMTAILTATLGCVGCQNAEKAGSGSAEPREVKVLKISDLCDNKLERVNRISEINQLGLIDWLYSEDPCFPKQVALSKINKLLQINSESRICSLEGRNQFVNALAKVSEISGTGKSVQALQNFMTALGHQLSRHCKHHALTHVDTLTAELKPEELEPAVELEQHGGFLLNPKELSLQNGDIWPTYHRLNKQIDEGSMQMRSTSIPVSEKSYVKLTLYKRACRDIYYPMSNRVFSVLEMLSKHGFDLSVPAGGDIADSPRLLKWLNIRLACGALNGLNQFDSQAISGFRLHYNIQNYPSLVLENRLQIDYPEQRDELAKAMAQRKKQAEDNVKVIFKRVVGKMHTIDKMFIRPKKLVEHYVLRLDAEFNKSSQ